MILMGAAFSSIFSIWLVLDATRVRPRRSLSTPLGDATERRKRLRLVMGARS